MVLHNHSWVNFGSHVYLHGRCTLRGTGSLTCPKVKEAAVSDRALLPRAPAKWSTVQCYESNWGFQFCLLLLVCILHLSPTSCFAFMRSCIFICSALRSMETLYKTFVDITEKQAFLSTNIHFVSDFHFIIQQLITLNTHTYLPLYTFFAGLQDSVLFVFIAQLSTKQPDNSSIFSNGLNGLIIALLIIRVFRHLRGR